MDGSGVIYIAEADNHLIRKVTPLVTLVDATLGPDSAGAPEAHHLSQNYPNPFNSGTVIRFALPASQHVELAIHNQAGQRVATLVEGAREAGAHAIRWGGRDGTGRTLASGVYLYRLRAGGGQVETRKLVLVR